MSLFPHFTARALPLGAAAALIAVAAAVGAETRQSLEDVQIGEAGDVLRVALICSARCDVKPGEGVDFLIEGVSAALDLDISGRSALADRLTIAPGAGASVLKIDAARSIDSARVVTCLSDTGLAPCVEFRFAPASQLARRNEDAAPPKPEIRQDRAGEAATAETPATQEDVPFIGSLIFTPDMSLRDSPAPGVIYLPQFAPPERFAPPSAPPREESDPSSERVDIRRPSLIVVDRAETLGAGAGFDIKEEAGDILGKSFDVGSCEGAKAKLLADAWALGAMIDLAYCKAADGKLEEADADFARLLEYTPDNYEALVGRGMIAIASGDRELGLSYYQDALNALPPIDESDRIVEAMRRN